MLLLDGLSSSGSGTGSEKVNLVSSTPTGLGTPSMTADDLKIEVPVVQPDTRPDKS